MKMNRKYCCLFDGIGNQCDAMVIFKLVYCNLHKQGMSQRGRARVRYGEKRALFSKFRAIQTWNLPKQHLNFNFLEWENVQKKLKKGIA